MRFTLHSYKSMLKIYALLVFFTLVLIGCGGGGGVKTASISGTVTDLNGNPVRGAHVFSRDSSTTTTATGAYILLNNREDDIVVKAEITQDSVKFRGENLAVTFQGERTQSVNIVVAPESQLASLTGEVQDRNGRVIEGASVFANGGGLSSGRAITDRNGHYALGGLIAGISYTLNAGGRGFGSDTAQATLAAREERQLNFVLSDAGLVQLPAPQNLTAVTWTSPAANGRSREDQQVYENIKRLFDHKRSSRHQSNRTSSLGNPIEVDLSWDPVVSNNLLGYGIYRSPRPDGSFVAIDFFREPLASYYVDLSDALLERGNYSYAITALSTEYPDNPQRSESQASNVVTVSTLGDLRLSAVTASPLTFNWLGGSGSTSYVVFVFDRYPGVGVDPIWDNSANPTTSTSLQYSGPGLVIGHRYYYLVLGLANNDDSRTISFVDSFVFNG